MSLKSKVDSPSSSKWLPNWLLICIVFLILLGIFIYWLKY